MGGDLRCVWFWFCPEGGSIEWSVVWAGAWSFVSQLVGTLMSGVIWYYFLTIILF